MKMRFNSYTLGSEWELKSATYQHSRKLIGETFVLTQKRSEVALVRRGTHRSWATWIVPADINNISDKEWICITSFGKFWKKHKDIHFAVHSVDFKKSKCYCSSWQLLHIGHKCGR